MVGVGGAVFLRQPRRFPLSASGDLNGTCGIQPRARHYRDGAVTRRFPRRFMYPAAERRSITSRIGTRHFSDVSRCQQAPSSACTPATGFVREGSAPGRCCRDFYVDFAYLMNIRAGGLPALLCITFSVVVPRLPGLPAVRRALPVLLPAGCSVPARTTKRFVRG